MLLLWLSTMNSALRMTFLSPPGWTHTHRFENIPVAMSLEELSENSVEMLWLINNFTDAFYNSNLLEKCREFFHCSTTSCISALALLIRPWTYSNKPCPGWID